MEGRVVCDVHEKQKECRPVAIPGPVKYAVDLVGDAVTAECCLRVLSHARGCITMRARVQGETTCLEYSFVMRTSQGTDTDALS